MTGARGVRLPSELAAPGTTGGAGGPRSERLGGPWVEVPSELERRLADRGVELDRSTEALDESSRDWWPVSIGWAARGLVPRQPAAVAHPADAGQVASVLAACSEHGVPVTPAGGRSGVCGGAVPTHGGLALDLTALRGIEQLDEVSLTADVRAGTFGPELEEALGTYGDGYTAGHWPQSMDLSTVGGWAACRGAGQLSTRYGKIEDIVSGLEVVLADGRTVDTRAEAPRSATGPSLTQLFLGSEGVLGVITSVRLRIHPRPAGELRRAYGFGDFAEGLDACRRILRRGARPAVLRLYDEVESARNFGQEGQCVLVVLDEADPEVLEATRRVVDQELAPGTELDTGLVGRWLEHRNDVSALAPLWQGGVVVDTAEVAGPWSALPGLCDDVLRTLRELEGTLVASVHESHAYLDGACLYFTFAGREPGAREESDPAWQERYYVAAWDRLSSAVNASRCALSHHHGIGLNRARFLSAALGPGLDVLAALKRSLDPAGILNPGGLGLPSPFGPSVWP